METVETGETAETVETVETVAMRDETRRVKCGARMRVAVQM